MTKNEADTQAEPQDGAIMTGPGALLRDAREAKGWTQAEVARRLNLRLAVIESIDSDQHKAGVAVTFLRGYVKAYAKLVGVPEADALMAFDAINQEPVVDSPMKSFSKKTRQQANDKWLKRISWLLFLGLLASLVYWWWQNGGALQMGQEAAITQQQNAMSQPDPSVQPSPAPEVTSSAPEAASSEAASSVTAEPSLNSASEPDAANALNVESDITAAQVNEVSTAPSAEQAEAFAAEPAANPELLTLRFSDACWIRIIDSRGITLSEGVKSAQQTLTLTGQPPFKVTLGVPNAVQMEYMNQAVDLSSFRAGRAARLTVPLD